MEETCVGLLIFTVLHSIFNRFKRDTFLFNLSSFQVREIIMWLDFGIECVVSNKGTSLSMLNTLRYKIVVHTRLFILALFLQFCFGHLQSTRLLLKSYCSSYCPTRLLIS